jgi:7-cyano-7-deazaguanine synthase in queuosine biosynthesis
MLQWVGERTGSLWTPMLFMEKRGVIHQLMELKLLKLTWWCDVMPGHKGTKSCGTCHSCAAHETALWKLQHHGPGFLWDGK